jgi:hypothetical protein
MGITALTAISVPLRVEDVELYGSSTHAQHAHEKDTQNPAKNDSTPVDDGHGRAKKRRIKNIQQRVFASGHPPDY